MDCVLKGLADLEVEQVLAKSDDELALLHDVVHFWVLAGNDRGLRVRMT